MKLSRNLRLKLASNLDAGSIKVIEECIIKQKKVYNPFCIKCEHYSRKVP